MDCSLVTTAEGCLFDSATGGQSGVVIHYVYGKNSAGTTILHKTLYTDAAGVPLPVLTGTQTVTAGVCQPIQTDVEFLLLCDDDDADPGTNPVQFVRKFTRTSNSLTGVKITETVEDFEQDLVTPYVVVGTVQSCGAGTSDTEDSTLCDSTGQAFIRRFVTINGVQITAQDLELDGVTVYVPVGAVGACPQCAPVTAQGVVTSWG